MGRVGNSPHALIIANRHAGSVTGQLVDEVAARCRRHGHAARVHWTTAPGDATTVAAAAARELSAEVVVAVGGDGTVREVVTGLHESGAGPAAPTMLIVPAGTGNSNYRAQWNDRPWGEALDAALTGAGSTVRQLDVMRLHGSGIVVLGGCTGLIAEALVIARHVPLSGRARYRDALAEAARLCHPYPGQVRVDGELVHQGPTVLANVGGGRYRGGQYQVLPHSLLDDGLLDVCVIGGAIDPVQVPELTREARHLDLDDVVYARGRRVTMTRTDGLPVPFEHDGELPAEPRTSWTLEVVPAAVPVFCGADVVTFGSPVLAADARRSPRP
jgi:diacylglycerol kinase (ATP)